MRTQGPLDAIRAYEWHGPSGTVGGSHVLRNRRPYRQRPDPSVFTGATFDATSIDPASVTLGDLTAGTSELVLLGARDDARTQIRVVDAVTGVP